MKKLKINTNELLKTVQKTSIEIQTNIVSLRVDFAP